MNFPAFYETRNFTAMFAVTHSWTGSPSEMNPGGTLILSFLIFYYNTFLPSTLKSPKLPPPFSFSSQYSTYISHAWFRASAASWTLRIGQIVCPETSVRNCRHSLRDNPEERSFPVFLMSSVCVTFSIHLIIPYHIALIKVCVQKNGNYGGRRATLYLPVTFSSLVPRILFSTFVPITAHCSPLSWQALSHPHRTVTMIMALCSPVGI